MDTAKKQDLLNKKAEQYRRMDATKKQKLLEKPKEEYTSRTSKKTVDSCVMEGPYNICCQEPNVVNGTEHYIKNQA